jgi:hypothetical protein
MNSCRICKNQGYLGELIVPCLCDGTHRFVHRLCLDRERRANPPNQIDMCPECQEEYQLEQVMQESTAYRKLERAYRSFENNFPWLMIGQLALTFFTAYITNSDPFQASSTSLWNIGNFLIYLVLVLGTIGYSTYISYQDPVLENFCSSYFNASRVAAFAASHFVLFMFTASNVIVSLLIHNGIYWYILRDLAIVARSSRRLPRVVDLSAV